MYNYKKENSEINVSRNIDNGLCDGFMCQKWLHVSEMISYTEKE